MRYLPYIVQLALLVYCLIECIQADSASVRNLGKTWWVVLIVLVPIVGPIAWLVAGRPTAAHRGRDVPWPATQTAGFPKYERPRPPRGPDDDPGFLADLRGPDEEHEKLLDQWEKQLREREERLRRGGEGSRPDEPTGPGGGDQAEPERG